MYMILQFLPCNTVFHSGDFVIPICNEDGSIKLFDNLREADEYANGRINSIMLRVISIEGAQN